jgi:hypothetical protein
VTGSILLAYAIDMLFVVSIKDTQIEVAAGIVNRPIVRVRIKYAVNDEICKCEEQTGEASGMRDEVILTTTQKGIKYLSWIW